MVITQSLPEGNSPQPCSIYVKALGEGKIQLRPPIDMALASGDLTKIRSVSGVFRSGKKASGHC